MTKQIVVSNFREVRGIVAEAAKCKYSIGVHDGKGSVADAKSILGMMSLDYSKPVHLVCESENDMRRVLHAMYQ